MPRSLVRQREKTLTCFCPFCGAKMEVLYDGTGETWERSTNLPYRCPKGHDLTEASAGAGADELRDTLHVILDRRARDGVGNDDRRPGE